MTTIQQERLVALIRSDQKAWLKAKVTPLRSLADVVRDILDQAIANENQRR